MRAKPIILSSAVLLFAGMSFAASFETASHSDVHSKSSQHDHHAGYVKPGAAVAMTHDYDGQTAPGEYETVTLTLSHIYKDGRLSIDMLPTANLQVFSNLPTQDIQLQTGSTLNLPIQFSGSKNGAYSIAIETVYESPEGQQSRRVLSVPIVIGDAPARKTPRSVPNTSKSTAEGFIALPATETIR